MGAGFIELQNANFCWTSVTNPWNNYRNSINKISFTGPITAGRSLRGLFRNLANVTELEGLTYFDTSQVTTMMGMFSGASSLTSLDLSSWDTSRIINMEHMFTGVSSLESLDLSNFNTSRVTNMRWFFSGASSLRVLTLGENFEFIVLHQPSWGSIGAQLMS